MLCLNCKLGEMVEPLDKHPSYVICDNCDAIELTYKPAEYQKGLHTVPYKYDSRKQVKPQILGIFGGYGSGKSRASLEEFFIRALESPNATGLVTAPTLQLLKRTTIKMLIDEIIPPPLIEHYNRTDGEIKLVNGYTIYTIPSDENEKLRSINAAHVHIEEASAVKRTIFDQLLSRLRNPYGKNRAIFVCSNPDLGWIKEVLVDNEKRANSNHPQHDAYNPYISVFIWPTKLNPHLPENFIEINSKGKPDWWRRRFLEGSFSHSEGMVYPNIERCLVNSEDYTEGYKQMRNVKFDRHHIPLGWERFITMDHGMRNPTAVYFNAIDPVQGEVVTYDEYYVSGKVVPEHAKALHPRFDEVPAGRIRFMVADPSTQNKTDPENGKSVQGLYEEYGIYWQPGNNNWEAGILKVNSYIERGKWKIFVDKCPELAKELVNYKYKEETMDNINHNLDERPVKANDHGADSIRYGFMQLPDDPELLKALSFSPPTRYNKYEIEEEFDYSDFENRDWTAFA